MQTAQTTVYSTDDDVFVIHIKVGNGTWVPLACTGKPAPYAYAYGNRAWEIANICYPDQCRSMRLGGEEVVRVTRLSPAKFMELYGEEPTPLQ